MSFGHSKSILDQLNIKVKNDLDNVLFWRNGGFLYTFKGETYMKFKVSLYEEGIDIRPESGYPKNITMGWKGIPGSFDSCGYVHVYNRDILMFTKGRNYWFYDETANKAYDNYPQDIRIFELFRHKKQFDKVQKIDAIFQWKDAGHKKYNCFVSGHIIFTIDISNPSTLNESHFSYMFPDLPNFINSATPFIGKPFIIFFSDFKWYLYDESQRKVIKDKDELNQDITENNITNQIQRMQEWCKQLYEKGIYSKEDYNICIRDSRLVGLSEEEVKKVNNNKYDKNALEYNYALHDKSLVGGKTDDDFNETETVYLISESGYYLKSDKDGNVFLTKKMNEPVNEYEWHIQRLGKDEYGLKDHYQKYLQGDSSSIASPNKYIDPMSKWNLVLYGTTFNIEHKDTNKSLKANPLGLEYYSPSDNMLWNIVKQNQDEIFKRYDPTEIENEKRYIIEAYKLAFKNIVIAINARNLEKNYSANVTLGFNRLSNYLRNYLENTAKKFYLPPPINTNLSEKDPYYAMYYNKTNGWTKYVGPGRYSIIRYFPFKNQNIKENNSEYASYYYKSYRVNGDVYYNKAIHAVNTYYNNDLVPLINNQRLAYTQKRNNNDIMLTNRIEDNRTKFQDSVKNVKQWKQKMEQKITEAEATREKLRRSVQYQLTLINKLKDKNMDLTDQISYFQNINTGNIDALKEHVSNQQNTLYMYYGLIAFSLLWIVILMILIYKN
jgi:hypothetical protein